jgi:hypothetical protein
MGVVPRFAFTLCVGFLALPSYAQRAAHGGAYTPGQYATTSAHGVAPIGGGRSFPVHSYGPAPLGLRAPAAGYTGIDPGALRNSNYGYGGFGFRSYNHRNYSAVPFGYFFEPYYYPFLDYGNFGDSDYSTGDGEDPAGQALYMQQNMLGAQIQQLSSELRQLRQQQEQPPVPPQAPPYAGAAQSAASDSGEVQQPITIVLRDGQQFKVTNYAVMDSTFWDFSQRPVRKFPVSSIDIPASTRATEASGAEFPQIGT